MTLLITIYAAIATTVVWYLTHKKRKLALQVPMFAFWGASLMWLVDAWFEYREMGAAYFTPEVPTMINDAFLGLSVVAVGFIIWLGALFLQQMQAHKVESAVPAGKENDRIG